MVNNLLHINITIAIRLKSDIRNIYFYTNVTSFNSWETISTYSGKMIF